jgi:hypothetical protein
MKPICCGPYKTFRKGKRDTVTGKVANIAFGSGTRSDILPLLR